ncbi:MAG TPA: hypothetical protein GXZ64_00065 [Clostridiaceae bacterium]|nr:hypothetical protein [Clostridiaceae bacterium]
MVVTQQNLTALELSAADKARLAQIAGEAGSAIPVYGSLNATELTLVAQGSALTRGDGTIRRVPIAISSGEVSLAPVTPYIPGADAQIKVYFLAENVINYVYSERVVADAEVLAWLEVRIEIVKTG